MFKITPVPMTPTLSLEEHRLVLLEQPEVMFLLFLQLAVAL